MGLVTANYHELTAKPTAINSDSMEIDATNLAKIKENQQISSLVLSGWAKADSAFVINEDEDYEDIVFPAYLQNRKFELRAEVTYNVNDQPKTVSYRKSFDWMNTDWQYCSVYLPLAYNDNGFIYTKSDITSIKFYFDYSYNTGNALYSELELKEAEWEANRYDKENKIAIQTSSHSPWTKTIYLNKDEMVERVVMSKKVIENGIQVEKQYENLYFYDKNNRLIKTIDYNGVVTENVFNDKGVQIKTLTYHKDEPTNVLYSAEKLLDDKGEEIGQTNEFGEKISSYEMIDGTGIVKTSTDNDGIKTSYGYNDNDDVIEMSTTIDDTANVNTYGYTLDFVTSLKHNDFEIAYNYDGQGRNNEILIAGQSYLTKSFADNEETTTLASNEVIKNVYDDDDNIIETHYQNEKIVQNDYDGYGNLSKTIELLTDETGAKQQIIHNYSYDKFGNVIKEETTQHAKNFNIINEYDINNNIDSTTFQIDDKNIFYNYTYSEDPEPKLVNILLPNNSNQSLHYDKLNRLDKIALLKEEDLLELKEFEYLKIGDHTSNLVSKLKFSDGETYNDILKYKYDEKGNITEIRQNNKLIARYKYDSLSRLVREDNLPFNKTFTYEYDAGGNILCRTEYSFTLAENLENLLCQTFDYSYSVSGWRDQLKSYNGESFKYDVLGNPETYRGKTLTWSHGRQLDKFGDIASYTYNASGIRTSKIINTEKIYWKKDPNVVDNSKKDFTLSLYLNNNKVLRQYDSFNDLIFYYGEDGVVGFNITILNDATHSGDYYYKKNTQNDIIGIYSTSGEQIVEYVYDAWGNQKIKYLNNEGEMVALREDYEYNNIDEINAFIAVKNPFRYRSYYYDFETNLYYLNSRYYDPQIGRFINADNISNVDKSTFNGLNLYAYCVNNPVMLTDSQGESWWSDFWKGVKKFFKTVGDVFLGVLSIGLVVGGILLTVFSGGSLYKLGSVMIGAGVGSFLGGLDSYLNGGSYSGGWLGGAVSGGLSGFGIAYGKIWGLVGGMIGNAAGTFITDIINGDYKHNKSYWMNLISDSIFAGLISMLAGRFGESSEILKNLNLIDLFIGISVIGEFAFSYLNDSLLSLLKQFTDGIKNKYVFSI